MGKCFVCGKPTSFSFIACRKCHGKATEIPFPGNAETLAEDFLRLLDGKGEGEGEELRLALYGLSEALRERSVEWPSKVVRCIARGRIPLVGDTPRERTKRTDIPGEFKCKDGHRVRSKAEEIIDDFLWDRRIRHVYEPEYSPGNGSPTINPDFYLPDIDVYVEIWGRINNPRYQEQKEYKREIYRMDNVRLIELDSEDPQMKDKLAATLLRLISFDPSGRWNR